MRTPGAVVALLLGVTSNAFEARPAVVWNAAVLDIAQAEDSFLTLKGLRTVAMMHIAMHDTLSAVHGRYQPLALTMSAKDVDTGVAVCSAAYHVAVRAYPEQSDRLERVRDECTGHATSKPGDAASHALGKRAANAIVRLRNADGWDTEADYQWHPMAPGVYAEFQDHSGTPKGFIFGAGWAKVRPFALDRPDHFRVPPPPDISSSAYARAFDEVKALGRFQSMQRTPDQTHLALWWKDFAESSHNRLARALIERENVPLQEAVRFLALVNMAIFDAYVSSFDNKFHYNHWRPYTAIRWAERDGNPHTQHEATWTNTHRHTYAFPSYPSAHGTACAAAMSVFEKQFGEDYAFEMHTAMVDVAGPFSGKIEMHPPSRSFDRFSDAAQECGASRVYLGIHFRYDSVQGVRLGRQVGAHVLEHRLARTHDDASRRR